MLTKPKLAVGESLNIVVRAITLSLSTVIIYYLLLQIMQVYFNTDAQKYIVLLP